MWAEITWVSHLRCIARGNTAHVPLLRPCGATGTHLKTLRAFESQIYKKMYSSKMVGGVLLFVYTWTVLTGVTVDDLAAFNMVKSP